ncbi:MAG: LytTR family DNA-binding domain-containing protein, partial [Pseudomonadota bacterium]
AKLVSALQHASSLSTQTIGEVASDARMDDVRKHICARAHGELRLIPIESVVSFQADQKYVAVQHDKGSDLIDESLKSLEAEFASRFVRIHRSALVAVTCIERLEKTTDGKTQVILRSQHKDHGELLVSRRHQAEVRRRLKQA